MYPPEADISVQMIDSVKFPVYCASVVKSSRLNLTNPSVGWFVMNEAPLSVHVRRLAFDPVALDEILVLPANPLVSLETYGAAIMRLGTDYPEINQTFAWPRIFRWTCAYHVRLWHPTQNTRRIVSHHCSSHHWGILK